MIDYFASTPAAALRREIDGHLYAYVMHHVTAEGVRECSPRMVRADGVKITNGVAYVWIGQMGDLIAQRLNLPFGIVAEQT